MLKSKSLEEEIQLLKSEIRSDIRSEIRSEIRLLRADGWVLRRNLDAKMDDKGVKELLDDLGAGELSPKNKKRKKKGAKKRAFEKGTARKRMTGVGVLALAISMVVLCITGLLVASNSGEYGSHRLQEEGSPATDSFSADLHLQSSPVVQDVGGPNDFIPSPHPTIRRHGKQKTAGFTVASSNFRKVGRTVPAFLAVILEASSSLGTKPPSAPADTSTSISICPEGLLPVDDYPGCCAPEPGLIGNGVCNHGLGNTKECGYDGGDCEAPEQIGTSPPSTGVEAASILPTSPDINVDDLPTEDDAVTNPPSSLSTLDDIGTSLSPSSYLFTFWPTFSSRPTKTNTPACRGANPELCGCGGSVKQSDYRGTINVTKSGKNCTNWDSYWYADDYPGAGVKNNNYCRSPDHSLAYCYIDDPLHDRNWEQCDVPYCMAGPAYCTEDDAMSDEDAVSEYKRTCDYHKCANRKFIGQPSDDTFLAPKRENVTPACQCLFELWDGEYGSLAQGPVYDCCREREKAVPSLKDSCECSIKLGCEGNEFVPGDGKQCHLFAEKCCEAGDTKCKCEYKKKACVLELYSNGSGIETEITSSYCGDAEDACCEDKNEIGGCKCDFWDPFCNFYPKVSTNDGQSCYWATTHCCGRIVDDPSVLDDGGQCKCDYTEHATSEYVGYIDPYGIQDKCVLFKSQHKPNHTREEELLKSFYHKTGGAHWFNNTGWTKIDQSSYCVGLFGISCDSENYITNITLSGNNLTGKFPANTIASFYRLKVLDLSNNSLIGMVAGEGMAPVPNYDQVWDTSIFFDLRELARVDLSQNQLSGEVDLLFTPALEYANFSHNNFTSFNSFKLFKKSLWTLLIADVSYNAISQNIIDILKLPPQLEELYLSSNFLHGTPLVTVTETKYFYVQDVKSTSKLKRLYLDSNRLSGSLSDFSAHFPNLQELDLSNQKQEANQGFTGTIPDSFVELSFLSTLNLADNQLNGTVPLFLPDLSRLQKLDLSGNKLSNTIPKALGKFADSGILDILDLSDNDLTGLIPTELSLIEGASINLGGNPNLGTLAPVELCLFPKFDLKDNTSYCPVERNALKFFFHSAKGSEWTRFGNWNDPYKSHCDWQGVQCKDSLTIELKLDSNGLSGTIDPRIANLTSLRYLNLANNDIMGSIPSVMGNLTDLVYLRLSHNGLTGTAPTELLKLQRLELFQLNGNRIIGTIPKLTYKVKEKKSDNNSSFVADCGSPSEFEKSLECKNCTMCCNKEGLCLPQNESLVQKMGFKNYMEFTWVFLAALVAACALVALYVYEHEKEHRQSTTEKDKKNAVKNLGSESVYQFLTGNRVWGWVIALVTMVLQICVLLVFVKASEIDLSSGGKSDMKYTWFCPRDVDTCINEADLNYLGWLVFVVLMIAHVLADIIRGAKMIVLSGKQRHTINYRIRFFGGGVLLCVLTLFSLYVSTIYNIAIASTNTEIVLNSVVVFFVCNLDEQFYGILVVINPQWVEDLSSVTSGQNDETSEIDVNRPRNSKIEDDVEVLKKELQLVKEKFTRIEGEYGVPLA